MEKFGYSYFIKLPLAMPLEALAACEINSAVYQKIFKRLPGGTSYIFLVGFLMITLGRVVNL